jgi:hypothetical protein
MWLLNRVVNPVVRALLRSRLHFALSRRLVLLRIRGRRTGRTFELPVGYVQAGGELVVTVAAPERKRWWRNIVDRTPVGVVLRGHAHEGIAVLDRTGGSTHVRITLTDDPAP